MLLAYAPRSQDKQSTCQGPPPGLAANRTMDDMTSCLNVFPCRARRHTREILQKTELERVLRCLGFGVHRILQYIKGRSAVAVTLGYNL